MKANIQPVLDHLKAHDILLVTAESCTAGQVIHLLSEVPGSGACLDAGYVVYSPAAKKRLLGVRQETIDTYNLTSEEVAREMVIGALKDSDAGVAISNTGLAGPDGVDGIPAGTVCFAWGFRHQGELVVFTHTEHFPGEREDVQQAAAVYSLTNIPTYHARLHGERG
ncbi:PncC family amidohydrolase [Pseudomonas duriflava]|uniref:PncC family amidohydrolase n=1 Tax=Pseudomonas duriflava TaxID=459528 RepID=A0A562Q2S3_9PSED|nr:CinA family protein [Pseudomonas duriflava]TWI50938.1 PncC family amidohydrolase [Pseudomonas duriflava]